MRSDTVKKGVERTPHRALLKAVGVTDADMGRPFIGIANAWNDIVPGHKHLRDLADHIRQGIREAGGVPFEFGVIGICDGIAMGHEGMAFSLPSREIIADSIEVMTEAHRFDGIVMLGTCDKIVPGMLMAALRMNVPCIVVTGGPMKPGRLDNKDITLITSFEGVGGVQAGKITQDELKRIEDACCPGCGSCQGLYTANTMACMTEALGMSLPGCATAHAVDVKKARIAHDSGKRIVELVKKDLKPLDIVSRASFENAIRLDMTIGGSTNTVLHLTAIAAEGDISLGLDDFDRISGKTPHLCNMGPAGQYTMKDLDEAGGIPAVLGRIEGLNNAPTVSGKNLGEIAKAAKVLNSEVIRPADNPVHKTGGISILYGNLAPDGAVVKSGAVAEKMLRYSGRAKVFDGEDSAIKSILGGGVAPGRRCGHSRLRAPGRPWHAGNAGPYVGHRRHGAERVCCAGHRRAVFRRHERSVHRPCLAGVGRRRPHRSAEGRRRDRHRHPRQAHRCKTVACRDRGQEEGVRPEEKAAQGLPGPVREERHFGVDRRTDSVIPRSRRAQRTKTTFSAFCIFVPVSAKRSTGTPPRSPRGEERQRLIRYMPDFPF